MRKSSKAVLAAVVVGGLGFGASSWAAAAPTDGTTIAFTEHETSNKTFNLGTAHGVAVGFIQLDANDDIQAGHKIGHDGGSCTITRVSNGTADDLCNVTFALTNGQIDAAGLVTSTPSGPGTFTIAIVGGTGLYNGARGEATVVSAQSPKITIHLKD
jgi:hypothetical protein